MNGRILHVQACYQNEDICIDGIYAPQTQVLSVENHIIITICS